MGIKDSVSRGNLNQTAEDLGMLLEMDPNNKEARFLRAVVYQKRGQFEKAVQDYQLLLKNGQNNGKAHYNLAMIYAFKLSNNDAALRHFDNFLTLEPKGDRAFEAAGIMCAIQKNLNADDAKRIFAEWNLKDVLRLAKEMEEEGNFSKAIDYYEKAVHLNPTWAEAHKHLGELLIKDGHRDKGNIHLAKASLFKGNQRN